MSDDIVVHTGHFVPLTHEMIADCPGDLTERIHVSMTEHFIYGQPRKHRNFMPDFVLFPRVQRALDWLDAARQRVSEVVQVARYGIESSEWE